MPFINNSKLKIINEAYKNGNEIAKKIFQALRKSEKQEDIDNLVLEFFELKNDQEPAQEIVENLKEDEEEAVEEYEEAASEIEEKDLENKEEVLSTIDHIKGEEEEHINELSGLEIEDLTDVLNQELDGLIDENEIEDETFSQFLSNKRRDKMRMSKNNEYFKIYNPNSREKYINDKSKVYNDKFTNVLKGFAKNHKDFENGIDYYLNQSNLFLDDDLELDNAKVNDIYEKITSDDEMIKSIGRVWDEDDKKDVMTKLEEYSTLFGKKNLIPALNFVKEDNNEFKKYRDSKVDEEIKRYSKKLSDILK